MSLPLKLYKLTGNPMKQLRLRDQERRKSATHFCNRLCKNVLKPKAKRKKISSTRIISSIVLILKVLDKINPYFTSLPVGPSIEVSWGFCFTYTFQSKLFFLHTMIYYVGNFRGYSLQLELLDWTPLADTMTPFFSACSCESQPHFHTQPLHIPSQCIFPSCRDQTCFGQSVYFKIQEN